jgi:hypothetical protein
MRFRRRIGREIEDEAGREICQEIGSEFTNANGSNIGLKAGIEFEDCPGSQWLPEILASR